MTTLTKTELQLIETSLNHLIDDDKFTVSKIAAIALRAKIADTLKGAAGGPFRSAHVSIAAEDNVLDQPWLQEAEALVRGMAMGEEERLTFARQAREAIETRVRDLEAELVGLKDVARIKAENERLRIELAAAGPEDIQENLATLQRKFAGALSDKEVLEKQVNALKQALRQERQEREVLESYKILSREPSQPQLAAAATPQLPAATCRECSAPLEDDFRVFCSPECRDRWCATHNGITPNPRTPRDEAP